LPATATNSAINSRLSTDPPPPPFVGGLTVTVTDCEAWPPSPVQVRVYVAEVVSAGVVNEFFTCCVPLQPPEAVQFVAFLTSQLKVLVLPESTVVGSAAKVITGAA